MYGAQTYMVLLQWWVLFENDVEMYGAQTVRIFCVIPYCLRMM